MLSDCAMLRSMGGLIPRKPPEGMSVVASAATMGWRNIHAAILEGRVEKFFDYSAPFPIVGFNLKGTTTLEWKRGSRFSRMHVQPGDLLITPAGDGHSVRSSHPTVVLLCCFDPARLRSLAEQEWDLDGSTIEIVEVYNRDAKLWALGKRLAARLRCPIPGSRLFAESLFTQIAIDLLSRYSSLPRPIRTPEETLSDPRLRRVVDYREGMASPACPDRPEVSRSKLLQTSFESS
jgi:hypothetical protein